MEAEWPPCAPEVETLRRMPLTRGPPTASKMPSNSSAAKDGAPLLDQDAVLHSGNWSDMQAIPVHDDIVEVEIEPVPLSAKMLSCVFAPLLPLIGCGFYTVDAKTEAAVMHMGQLTEMQKKAGLHCGWPCGRANGEAGEHVHQIALVHKGLTFCM